MDDDAAKGSFQLFDSRKQKGSVLLGACNLLVAEQDAWVAAVGPSSESATVSSILNGQPPQDESDADILFQADASRKEASVLLHAAASSALSDLKQQHELEGKLLTSSMMAASKATAASKPFSRRHSSSDVHASKRLAAPDQPASEQPGAFATACAQLWVPLQRNREADKLYWSKKHSMEELSGQDVRFPRR